MVVNITVPNCFSLPLSEIQDSQIETIRSDVDLHASKFQVSNFTALAPCLSLSSVKRARFFFPTTIQFKNGFVSYQDREDPPFSQRILV
jgi:hypothetical protein